jgi:hypothetical protein
MAPQEELIDRLMMSAYQAGDQERFIELAGQRRTMMSEEERRGRQAIAGYAAQILATVPPEQRQAAIRQGLAQLGIDPSETGIDDISDPAQLEQALILEIARGDPEGAAREGVRVQGTRTEYRRPEMVDQGNQRVMVSTSGTNPGAVLGQFAVTADPNAVLVAQTQRRGQDVSAATARRGQDLEAQIARDRAALEARRVRVAEDEARTGRINTRERLEIDREANRIMAAASGLSDNQSNQSGPWTRYQNGRQ